jgi:hypothetical protein
MTDLEFRSYLSVVSWACAAFCVLNVFQVRRRGTVALVLASAFLVAGASVQAYLANWDRAVWSCGGIVTVALVLTDAFLRLPKQSQDREAASRRKKDRP